MQPESTIVRRRLRGLLSTPRLFNGEARPRRKRLVRQYLTVAASCKVATRPDQLGLKVGYVNETSGTHINTRAFLCALRRFYDFLIERSDYTDANPLAVTGYS